MKQPSWVGACLDALDALDALCTSWVCAAAWMHRAEAHR